MLWLHWMTCVLSLACFPRSWMACWTLGSVVCRPDMGQDASGLQLPFTPISTLVLIPVKPSGESPWPYPFHPLGHYMWKWLPSKVIRKSFGRRASRTGYVQEYVGKRTPINQHNPFDMQLFDTPNPCLFIRRTWDCRRSFNPCTCSR